MGIYRVPISYGNLDKKEETISARLGNSIVEISISPIPETNKALISIIEEGEPLVMNQICTLSEFIMRKTIFPTGFIGDFMFGYTSKIEGEFDINRLGYDVFLVYIDGDNYEG